MGSDDKVHGWKSPVDSDILFVGDMRNSDGNLVHVIKYRNREVELTYKGASMGGSALQTTQLFAFPIEVTDAKLNGNGVRINNISYIIIDFIALSSTGVTVVGSSGATAQTYYPMITVRGKW